MFRSISLFLLLATCVAFVGCGKTSVDPALVAKHKKTFALAEEPEAVQTVFEVREVLLGHTEEDHDHEGETSEEHAAHSHEGESAEEHAAHDHDHEGETAEEHAAHDHDHEGHDHAGHDHHNHEFPTEAKEVAMVGQIGGLANPWEETQPEFPFSTNFAVFFLADPQAVAENAEAGHVHAPGEECAFCASHAEENSEQFAMIRLLDDKGKPLPIDVREIFDITDNDTVVVKGSAQIVEGGMLVVKATGIYVRK